MKKTLMVLSLALCATLAFAQTQNVTTVKKQGVANAKATMTDKSASYKATVFTKDETPIQTWSFSADNAGYTIHNVGSGEYVDGTLLTPHSQTATFAQWQRFAGIDQASLAVWGNAYPVSISYYDDRYRTNYGYGYFEHFMDPEACSSTTGFMIMSMQDQIQEWGGTGSQGNFHSAICFDQISTTGVPVIVMRMFQYMRKFNADSCYIDYSSDNSTWHAMRINVRNIDVAVNSALWGNYGFTLPAAAGNQASLYLRLRWECHSSTGGAYGYIWMLDDVEIYAAPANSLRKYDEVYLAGGYHIMPQGLNLPISWGTNITNNGYLTQNNLTANIYHIDANGTATPFVTESLGNLAAGATQTVVIDDAGFPYDAQYLGWARDENVNPANPRCLPTTATGEQAVMAKITSDSLTAKYDSIIYNVNVDNNGNRIWGYDNGILTRGDQIFAEGVNPDYYYDDAEYYTAGYMVTARYKVGAQVPDNWVIRGVQLVPSNYVDPETGAIASRPGSIVEPVLYWDYHPDADHVSFYTVNTGADVHTVAASELNDTNSIGTDAGRFLTFGNYNTVDIEFPNQPALEPNTEFRIGYRLAQNGSFAVATSTDYYTYMEDGEEEVIYFRNDTLNGMKKYAPTFGVPCTYDIYFADPTYEETGWGAFADMPMVRMIVGPYVQKPTQLFNVECEFNEGAKGAVLNPNQDSICGMVDTVVEGSKAVYYFEYSAGDDLTNLYIDGVEVQLYDEETDEGDENFVLHAVKDETTGAYSYYKTYTFRNVSAAHTIRAIFGPEEVSVNSVESHVDMQLVPNPASQQVKLHIAGVSGMVDCSLIDMSGRVVMSKKLNAEAAQTLDLSGLAKGAYFVRVTNNQFSKVEKLIVR